MELLQIALGPLLRPLSSAAIVSVLVDVDGSADRRPLAVVDEPVAARAPSHQQPKEAVLGGRRQELVDERRAVSEREQDARREELRAQVASGYEPDEVEPGRIRILEDFRRLPLSTKQELVDDQHDHPPYGTNLTYPLTRYCRLHQTSGTTGTPMRWLDTPRCWDWLMGCWAQIYRIVGLREDDVLAFPFSFGPFIGFWSAHEAARRLGALTIPGGGLDSPARLRLLLDTDATVVLCTPTYALRLADVAREHGLPIRESAVRATLHAGEPGASIPAVRARIAAHEAVEGAAQDETIRGCCTAIQVSYSLDSPDDPSRIAMVLRNARNAERC